MSFRSFSRVILPAAAALALAGCFSEGESEPRERVAAPASAGTSGKSWLDPRDSTPPGLWLASRQEGRDVAPSDPAVARWDALLADADSRFDETDRMIANRAVQLEGMLKGVGVDASADAIIRAFLPLAEPGSQRGFGALCQHYYNLRASGEGAQQALAALRQPAREGGTP